MSALKKAVFLDRDGVLCEDTDYITSFEKLHIYPFAKKAVEQIHKKGYLVIVVTNQSGVARGYLAEEMLQKLNAYLQKETGVECDLLLSASSAGTGGDTALPYSLYL